MITQNEENLTKRLAISYRNLSISLREKNRHIMNRANSLKKKSLIPDELDIEKKHYSLNYFFKK